MRRLVGGREGRKGGGVREEGRGGGGETDEGIG